MVPNGAGIASTREKKRKMMRARSPMQSGLALALLLCCSGLAAASAPGASSELIPLEQFTRYGAKWIDSNTAG
jgi:hypothetical protein